MSQREKAVDLYGDLLTCDLDIDIWGYGRDAAQAGRLCNEALRASYPFVEVKGQDRLKVAKALQENYEPDHNCVKPYLLRGDVVFFQTKEDLHLFYGLLLVSS